MAFFSPHTPACTRACAAALAHTDSGRARICALSLVASAVSLLTTGWAQAQSQAPTLELSEITITESAPTQVSGWGAHALDKTPLSATVWDAKALRDAGAQRVSDALRLDASVADSYNSPAYWDMLSVRGYTLDNRYNYRREGLPMSAETMIGMDNKERIELLKGTSGIQAGTSAPGGLVNYLIKRPPPLNAAPVRSLSTHFGPGHNRGAALDLGDRFGLHHALGYRLNLAYEDLNPVVRHATGQRHLLALAMDWRISADQKLEWEIERSERRQLGVGAYSLHGNALPAPVNGKTNPSQQSWSVPSLFAGTTGSVRHTHHVGQGLIWTTQYGVQQLQTDDRLAFAFGATTSSTWLSDRFAPNGSFDVYDYRSQNERRTSQALQTGVSGHAQWAGLSHSWNAGLMRQSLLDRPEPTQLYSYAGTSSGAGAAVDAQTADAHTPNTYRSEYSTEWHLSDRMAWSETTAVWLGLRHTQYRRGSERHAACDPLTYACTPAPHTGAQHHTGQLSTPWLGLTHERNGHTLYASYGQGAELATVPNNPAYTNAGQLLAVAKSQQWEAGIRKGRRSGLGWHASVFAISRPWVHDVPVANTFMNTRHLDGQQNHQGAQAGIAWKSRAWQWDAQAQWLHARIANSAQNPALNGTQPLNVPAWTVRAAAQYHVASVPGLRTRLHISHEGKRHATEGGGMTLPSWTVLDGAAHWDTRMQGLRAQWTLAIDNLTDRRYWREAPKQFGHHYLYPGAPRTLRLALTLGW